MDQNGFDSLLEAAALLDDSKMQKTLQQMQSVCQQKQYFIAFIGQYSAGKSCLLNSLLKRRLLPEGTMETTPLLTYIRYGEQEEARLHYVDGAVRIIELAQVARLTQQTEDRLDRLDFLEVYLSEELLRAGMILLDTPGVNTLLERHEQLLEDSLSLAAGIVYVAGRAPSCVDVDKLSMLTEAGFEVTFVRTHCDEIKEQEETLEQVRKAEFEILEKCGISQEQCYYVSNDADSPLFAELNPLRNMLREKGRCASAELESAIERQLLVQAKQSRAALQNRRTLLEQMHEKNTEVLEEQRATIIAQISRLESRLEAAEEAIHQRVQLCRKALQEDVAHQLEMAIQRSVERIKENTAIQNETEMTALLHREMGTFSRDAYELINAVLDSLVQEVNGEISVGELELEWADLPQAMNYQELCADQDELTKNLRSELISIQEHRADLERALEERSGSPEYIQLQQELQELQTALVEVQKEWDGLPPYVPQMIWEEDGRMQPSQIARSIGAAADWAMLLIPGAQIEAAMVKAVQIPKVAKTLGKFVGVLEKTGKVIKQGDTIKDILFALKNVSKHTRTSKRREKKAGEMVAVLAKGAGTGVDALHRAKQDHDSDSVLDLLTVEYWAGKLGEQFDRPPHLVVDQEYENQYKEAKGKLEFVYRETQQKAYQKKLELGLFQTEEEQLRAKEESLRINQEVVSKELAKRETELRLEAKRVALKKWRSNCAVWYCDEMTRQLQNIIHAYQENCSIRLEEYQHQRSQALRDALEKEQTAYHVLENAPKDKIALELQHVDELLESINDAFFN